MLLVVVLVLGVDPSLLVGLTGGSLPPAAMAVGRPTSMFDGCLRPCQR
jgi:hypothetical protein